MKIQLAVGCNTVKAIYVAYKEWFHWVYNYHDLQLSFEVKP